MQVETGVAKFGSVKKEKEKKKKFETVVSSTRMEKKRKKNVRRMRRCRYSVYKIDTSIITASLRVYDAHLFPFNVSFRSIPFSTFVASVFPEYYFRKNYFINSGNIQLSEL